MVQPLPDITLQYVNVLRQPWYVIAAPIILTGALVILYYRQWQVARRQTEISERMGKLQRLLAIYTMSPLIVPTAGWHGDPLRWAKQGSPWKNNGQGPAFDIQATYWSEPSSHPLAGEVRPPYAGTRDPVNLLPTWHYEQDTIKRCLVLHYKAFGGETWHTTLNVDEMTGEIVPNDLRTLRIFNPQLWKELPEEARRRCMYCPEYQAASSS